MLLDQETLRLIFGLKLRTLRQNQELSLKELAKKTRLSPSYINEIEQGKKYPKTDKIMVLAHALNVPYDKLISLQLHEELGTLSHVLGANLLQGLPFDVFGIPAQTIFKIMGERPQQFSALVGTLLDVARKCNVRVEDFFDSTLRSYLDMNHNFFPDLEDVAEDLRKTFGTPTLSRIKEALHKNFNLEVTEQNFDSFPTDVRELYFLYFQGKPSKLIVNQAVSDREKMFIYCKELAHCHLGHAERFSSNVLTNIDSFEKLFNNFKASYIASALLIPREKFVMEAQHFFSNTTWNPEALVEWVQSIPGTIESFFHRLTQVIPTFFKIDQMFFLGFSLDERTQSYNMTKELHLSTLHAPHGVKSGEHYCRRWITISLIKKLKESGLALVAGAQRSSFFGSENEYLCLAVARPTELKPHIKGCFTIGLRVDEALKKRIRFVDDPTIVHKVVSATCEQCAVNDCSERVAPPTILNERNHDERIHHAMDLISQSFEHESRPPC